MFTHQSIGQEKENKRASPSCLLRPALRFLVLFRVCLLPCMTAGVPAPFKRELDVDFPGGLETETLHSQCRGPRFDPWSGK